MSFSITANYEIAAITQHFHINLYKFPLVWPCITNSGRPVLLQMQADGMDIPCSFAKNGYAKPGTKIKG